MNRLRALQRLRNSMAFDDRKIGQHIEAQTMERQEQVKDA